MSDLKKLRKQFNIASYLFCLGSLGILIFTSILIWQHFGIIGGLLSISISMVIIGLAIYAVLVNNDDYDFEDIISEH